jgi:DNA polymerase III subunit delta'
MNAPAPDPDEAPHPRVTHVLFGHTDSEATLLGAYRSGRFPHALLLVGQQGIGKATLAYRLARFMLAHPDPSALAVQSASSLAVEPLHPVARRVAAQAHGDLLIMERTPNEKGVMRQQIAVEDVRRSVTFFGATAGEGGWRIAIVDAVDELNRSSANALLKVLEEPPLRSLLLLVSHSPARVPPTLRSRCRVVALRPLPQADVAAALAIATGRTAEDPQIEEAAAAGSGSVGRAWGFLGGEALAVRQQALRELDRLPEVNPRGLHALGEALAGTDPQTLAALVDTVNAWLAQRLDATHELARLARLAEAFERINQAARAAAEYNLERKPLVFNVFSLLAEATRG